MFSRLASALTQLGSEPGAQGQLSSEEQIFRELYTEMQFSQLELSRQFNLMMKDKEGEIQALRVRLGEGDPPPPPAATTPSKTPLRELSQEDFKVVLKEWERKLKSNIAAKSDAEAETRLLRQTVEMLQQEQTELKKLISNPTAPTFTQTERENHAQAVIRMGQEFSQVQQELELAKQQLAMGNKHTESEPILVAGGDNGLLVDQLRTQMQELVELNSATELELKQKADHEQAINAQLTLQLNTRKDEFALEQQRLQAQIAQLELDASGRLDSDELEAKQKEWDALRESLIASHEADLARLDQDGQLKLDLINQGSTEQQQQLEREKSKLQSQLAETEAQLAIVRTELESKFQLVQQQLDEANHQLDQQTALAQSDKQALATANELASNLQSQLDQTVSHHTSQLSQVEDQLQASIGKTIELEQSLAQLHARAQESSELLEQATLQATLATDAKQALEEQSQHLSLQLTTSQQQVKDSQVELDAVRQLFLKECALRRMVHDELMDLKGNIRVFARIRPAMASESGELIPMNFSPEEGVLVVNHQNRFEFDAVFDLASSQEQVFNTVAPFLVSVMDGVNVTLLAYGQTGSGKTFTMQGSAQDPGVNTRSLTSVFELAKQRSDAYEYTFVVSVLEIYLEQVLDLLNPQQDALEIRIHPDTKQNYCPGLTTRTVTCLDDVEAVLVLANKNRTTASHNMNEHSSRSHLVFTLECLGVPKVGNAKKRLEAKLTLIDLAGSERVSKTDATGEQLKEAQAINKSLSALGDVISALGSNTGHVPFRNSKLTYLLQDQLGGSGKVGFFANCHPTMFNLQETVFTLKFAERCRKTELKTRKRAQPESTSTTPSGKKKADE